MLNTATSASINTGTSINTVPPINDVATLPHDHIFFNNVSMGQFVDVEIGGMQQNRFKSFLIGVKENKYLILEQPDIKRFGFVRNLLIEGQAIVIRTICEKTTGECLAFSSFVEGIVNHPQKLLFISYPTNIQKRELRKEQRKILRLPAKISLENQAEHIPGNITDISDGGCRVEILVDEKVKGIKQEHIYLEYEDPEAGSLQRVHCKVCSQRKELSILSIGVAFTKPLNKGTQK